MAEVVLVTTVSSVRVEAATEGGGGGFAGPLPAAAAAAESGLFSLLSRRAAAIPAAKLALRDTLIPANQLSTAAAPLTA